MSNEPNEAKVLEQAEADAHAISTKAHIEAVSLKAFLKEHAPTIYAAAVVALFMGLITLAFVHNP